MYRRCKIDGRSSRDDSSIRKSEVLPLDPTALSGLSKFFERRKVARKVDAPCYKTLSTHARKKSLMDEIFYYSLFTSLSPFSELERISAPRLHVTLCDPTAEIAI